MKKTKIDEKKEEENGHKHLKTKTDVKKHLKKKTAKTDVKKHSKKKKTTSEEEKTKFKITRGESVPSDCAGQLRMARYVKAINELILPPVHPGCTHPTPAGLMTTVTRAAAAACPRTRKADATDKPRPFTVAMLCNACRNAHRE